MPPVLSDEQKADVAHVAALAEPREVVRLDLSDERQFRHAIDMHVLAGQTPVTHPGLHRALAATRAQHLADGGPGARAAADPDGFETGAMIVAVGRLMGTQNVGSEGFATVLGGAAMLTVALNVFDDSQNLLASGSNEQYGDGTYLGVATQQAGAKPLAPRMTAILQYTYQREPGDPIIAERVRLASMSETLAPPNVEHPVKTETESGDPRIRIGLGRGTGKTSDVDYWFSQSMSDTFYAVPMVGYVDFVAPIQLPASSSVKVAGYLARGLGDPNPSVKGGQQPIPDPQKTNIINNCQIAGNRLRWSLPAASKAEPSNPGNPIVWGALPWSSDETVWVVVQFMVQLVGGGEGFAAVSSGKASYTDALDGVTIIPTLDFIYHCIAADAQIMLADGSERRLEELGQDDVVRCASDARALRIVATRAAAHRGAAIRLAAGGRELVLTPNHLVLTPDGPCRADALAPGDMVLTAGGAAALSAAEVVQYDGVLCNLAFNFPGEPVDPASSAMLANGIAVCDYSTQAQIQAQQRADPERILSVLDPMFHEDFKNHLERNASSAAAP
jgi:hypothetical protein